MKELSKKDELEYYNKTIRLLQYENFGYNFVTDRLKDLQKIAENYQSDFYDLAVKDSDIIEQFDFEEAIIKQVNQEDEYFSKIAENTIGTDSLSNSISKEMLIKYFIKISDETKIIRVVGNSMINAGINDGDILIYNENQQPSNGQIIVCRVNKELFVKKYFNTNNEIMLVSENPAYKPVIITTSDKFEVIGILIQIIKDANK